MAPERTAQPFGACEDTERFTAFHARLLKITVRSGRLWARAVQWAEVGVPKRYAPSPTQHTTVLSGAASLAPSAAPRPQPRPEAGDWLKYEPGLVSRVCAMSRSYSFTTIVSSSMASPTHRESHAMSIGESFVSDAARVAAASLIFLLSASQRLRRVSTA